MLTWGDRFTVKSYNYLDLILAFNNHMLNTEKSVTEYLGCYKHEIEFLDLLKKKSESIHDLTRTS